MNRYNENDIFVQVEFENFNQYYIERVTVLLLVANSETNIDEVQRECIQDETE
jgi:hypothetical protein